MLFLYIFKNLFNIVLLPQYLYLANNQIAFLPDGFFEYFPLLRWLDLRYNCLTHLPSISRHGHDELRCLLIEGNAIRRLPLQLGKDCLYRILYILFILFKYIFCIMQNYFFKFCHKSSKVIIAINPTNSAYFEYA